MLGAPKTKILKEVLAEPEDIEASAIEDVWCRSSFIFPPVGKVIKGEALQARVEKAEPPILDKSTKIDCQNELKDLLSLYDDYSESPTYLVRVSSLLQMCGNKEDAAKFARQAADVGKSPFFSYRLGEVLLDEGNIAAARNNFRELAEKGYVDAKLRLAELSVNDQDLDSARAILDEILSTYDEYADWRVQLLAGTLSLVSGEYETAIRHYREALQDRPNSGVIYLNLAIAHYFLGYYGKALREGRKAVGLNPWNRKALSFYVDLSLQERDCLDSSERLLERYISFLPADKSLVNRLADLYFYQEKNKKGIRLLENAKSVFNDPGIWNNLGAFKSKRNKKEGLIDFGRAIEAAGGIPGCHRDRGGAIAVYNLASAYVDIGSLNEAKNIVKQFIDSAPDDYYLKDEILCRIPLILMQVYVLQDSLDEAINLAEEILGNNRVNSVARSDVSAALTSYYSFVTGEREKALKCARFGYDLAHSETNLEDGKRNIAINNLAFVLIEMGRLEEAKPIISELRADLGYLEYAFATRGLYSLKLGHLEKGVGLYEKAIKSASTKNRKNAFRQKFNLEVGRYWVERGEFKRAARYLRKVISGKKVIRDLWKIQSLAQEADLLLKKISKT